MQKRFVASCLALAASGCAPTTSPPANGSKEPAAAPWPGSGAEHPFAKSVERLNTSSTEGSTGSEDPQPEEAVDTHSTDAAVDVQGRRFSLRLEATPEVSAAALKNLAATIRIVPTTAANAEMDQFMAGGGKLLRGAPEVRLSVQVASSNLAGTLTHVPASRPQPQSARYAYSFPDNWIIARPGVLRLDPAYEGEAREEADDSDVGRATAALTGNWNEVRGQVQCQVPGEATTRDLPFVEVTIGSSTRHADENGRFSLPGRFTDVTALTVRYDGNVEAVPGVAEGPRMSVMNDFHNPRSETFDIPGGSTSGRALLADVTPSGSLDCELYEVGAEALQAYHDLTRTRPSAPDGFRIKRWEGIDVGTPHSYYDYTAIATNFRGWASANGRRSTIYHELGHTLRHADDGDLGHWGWDNFRWAYARNHAGNEIFNEQYAFNEGWGQYWECTRSGAVPPCPAFGRLTVPADDHLDWVELRIGRRLVAMSAQTGVGHAAMARLSRDFPGEIHTLRDFENKYCARFRDNDYCAGGRPTRAKTACPPDYHDDGATCRLDNIRAKPSRGRGVGTVPTGCGSQENNAGLCYQRCPAGWDGVGPVCWRDCPAGMHDDGAFCRRDVSIISSDNSACPWYDVCGLTFERGCSTCPAGYQNDGCTCRIDAWIFAKETRPRGAGTLPTGCGPGREYDAGLCYPRCPATFNGVGPVCWGQCPAGYADHGATCYRDPQVIVKY